MHRKLADVLATLPANRCSKIDGRTKEMATHRDLRPVADQRAVRASTEEQAALAVKAWNNLHKEGGSFADGHSTL
jgi:hypothetical protein